MFNFQNEILSGISVDIFYMFKRFLIIPYPICGQTVMI